jgi:choline dehydrogenase-like flavoprotein
VESGGLEFDVLIDSLNRGTVVSTHHSSDAMSNYRRRQYGGASNLWVYRTEPDDGRRRARMLMPQRIDFEERFHPSRGGWPFDRQILEPFFRRAHLVCGLGDITYDPGVWGRDNERPLDFGESRLTTIVCHHAAGDVFLQRYRDDIMISNSVTLLHHANVVEAEPGTGKNSVERIRVACLGSTFSIEAKYFVLAAGGIENARLLLSAKSADGRGLGNDNDLVGRYLMDHSEFRLGALVPKRKSLLKSMAFYDLRWVNGLMVSGQLAFKEDVLRENKLLSTCFMLTPKPRGSGSPGERSLKMLALMKHGLRVRDALHHSAIALRNIGDVAASVSNKYRRTYSEFNGGWSRLPAPEKSFAVVEITAITEQLPNPTNRVVLTADRDRFGVRRAQVHWDWGRVEIDSIHRAQRILAEDLARAGLGRIEPWVDVGEATWPRWPGMAHPMGTTRMHRDPQNGVVDEECKVHGISNLFVAGSSVFPTSLGHANPTLSIVALSIRLADHLKTLLSQRV